MARLRRHHRRGRYARGAALSWGELRLTLLTGAFMGLAWGVDWSATGVAPRWRAGGGEATGATWFGRCHTGGGVDCVVDGDTFWIGGERVRMADIDTPETHPPRCAEEARLGEAATERLQELLNAGPVTLGPAGDRDVDRYGRKLRIVSRDGISLGDVLVVEGLARPYGDGRRPWCGSA